MGVTLKRFPPRPSRGLFAPLKDNTRCVVLNACYTETPGSKASSSRSTA